MAFVRKYRPSDHEAMVNIFATTASPHLVDAGKLTLHYTSYLWCRPYLALVPQTVFVVDDGTGLAVGYLLGCPDTARFAINVKQQFLPALDPVQDVPPPGAEATSVQFADDPALWARHEVYYHLSDSLVKSDAPRLLNDYPAHLHIDILPSHQRKGYGSKLMDAWQKEMMNLGIPGCHLGMEGGNQPAALFYEQQGWKRFDGVLDGGQSGESGKDRGGGVVLVKKC